MIVVSALRRCLYGLCNLGVVCVEDDDHDDHDEDDDGGDDNDKHGVRVQSIKMLKDINLNDITRLTVYNTIRPRSYPCPRP